MPIAVFRCALAASIRPRREWDTTDEEVAKQTERYKQRIQAANDAEMAWILNESGEPDWPEFPMVTVATRVQGGVICLISALAFHELTTQIPHEIHVALQRGAEIPRLDYPPIKLYWVSDKAYSAGAETHELDGVSVRIYSPEKTLADCFKFRNKIGLDTAVEAVRFYRERRTVNVDALMRYAGICRVEKVMRPYLEVIL